MNRGDRTYDVCIDKCPLRVYSGWNSTLGAFQIKFVTDKHECIRISKLKKVIVDLITNQFRDRIIGKPNITQKQLVKICLEQLKVYIKASIVRKAKANILEDHCR